MKITPPTVRDLRRITCPSAGDKILANIAKNATPKNIINTTIYISGYFAAKKIFKEQGIAPFYGIIDCIGPILKSWGKSVEYVCAKFSPQ